MSPRVQKIVETDSLSSDDKIFILKAMLDLEKIKDKRRMN